MKNEQLLKAIEKASASFIEAVKAMTQLSNAVLSLNKKHDVNEKTAPLPNTKPNEIKEWNESMLIWKKIMIKTFPDEFKNTCPSSQITDALSGMHEDDKLFPDYVCVIELPEHNINFGDVFRYESIENLGRYYYVNITNKNDIVYTQNFFILYHKDHFKVYDQQKAATKAEFVLDGTDDTKDITPLKLATAWTDLAKEVEAANEDTINKYINAKFPQRKHSSTFYDSFNTLKHGQVINFELRNGIKYRAEVLGSQGHYFLKHIWNSKSNDAEQKNDIFFTDLNQSYYKKKLNDKYQNVHSYPSAPTLERLTADLNFLITLPDLNKNEKPNELKLNKQCEELIEKFMPLVNKWKFEGNTIINEAEHYNGVWSYSDNNKRKAAIRCAILHCELLLCKIIHNEFYLKANAIKNKLQKMLSE